ncbi:MAG: hypothetical protein JWN34_3916 [Bryobacterales bacterium]|nr:hypothetical protein [Bryobacterales bacterium]
MKRILAIATAMFALAGYSLAQNAAGTLTGTVTDASGAAIPAANVTVENVATNVKQTIPTNAEGRFYQRYVLPGTYSVTVEKTGFQKSVTTGIGIAVEQTVSLNIGMKLGDVATTVEVSASTAQLSTESSTVATTIGQKAVLDLPIQGRNPLSLAALVPGVVTGNGGSTPWISGGRNNSNDVTIDGTSVIVPENNVSNLQVGYTPIEDSVAEVSVVTNSLAAEYGRTGGGTINIATRGGTNTIHATLFEFNRNDKFNANSWSNIRNNIPRNVVRFNQFGGSVGGPIYIPKVYDGRSKTFFFFSEQSTRQPTGQSPTLSVPTVNERNGIFTGWTNGANNGLGAAVTIYDPLTSGPNSACPAAIPNCFRQAFANNVIPPSRVDPVAKKLLTFMPLPNSPSSVTNAALQTNNFRTTGSSTSPNNRFDARVDHNFSEKLRAFVRVSNDWGYNSNFNVYGNPGTNGGGDGPTTYYNRNATFNAVYSLNPTTIINFNYGFARDYSIRLPFSQGTKPSDIGLPASLDGVVDNFEFPQVTFRGNQSDYNLGQASFTTLYNFPSAHIFRGDLTKIMGRHTLKTGGTYEKLFVNFTQLGSPTGQFAFTNANTQQIANGNNSTTQGIGMASFLLGLPTNNGSDLQFTFSAATASAYMGGYVQDDWKVTSKLSVNLGLRYDVDTPRTERYNRLSYWDVDAVSPLQGQVAASAICPSCGNLKGAMRFVGTDKSSFGRRQTPTDTNNWGPRIGFAWNGIPKTVIRGAYGILYSASMLQAAGTSGSSGTAGFTGSTALNTTLDNGQTFVASLSNPFPNGIIKPQGSKEGPISGSSTSLGNGIGDTFFIDYRNPVIQQWNMNVQREVKGGWILMAGYLGSKGQHLPDGESSMQYNQLPTSYWQFGNNLLANVPNPFFGKIQDPTSTYYNPTIQARLLLTPYPQYNGVGAFRKPQANSIYHSFIASAEHRYSNGLSMQISFTGGKLLDDASQVVSFIGQAGTKQDFYCRKCEKSVSAQDVPARLVTSFNYDLPIGKGRKLFANMPKVADAFIGGWQINGVNVFQKGIPIAIGNNGNSANLGAPGIRPTATGIDPYVGGNIGDRQNNYFNQAAFTQTPNFAFGTVGRFLPNVRQVGTHNLDFSIFKNYHPIEKAQLQLRGEFYNATNTNVWSNPGTTIGTSTFGIVTSKVSNNTSQRSAQLGIKLIF